VYFVSFNARTPSNAKTANHLCNVLIGHALATTVKTQAAKLSCNVLVCLDVRSLACGVIASSTKNTHEEVDVHASCLTTHTADWPWGVVHTRRSTNKRHWNRGGREETSSEQPCILYPLPAKKQRN